MVHIDQHQDNDPALDCPRGATMSLPALADYTRDRLEISDFIDAASRIRIGAEAIIDHYKVNYVMPGHNYKGYSILTAYYDSENPGIARRFDGRIISLERVGEVLAAARAENRPIICDIDLDYFAPLYGANSGRGERAGYYLEDALQRVIGIAGGSDFVTIATSPNYFLVPDIRTETVRLLSRIVRGLDS